MPDKFTPCGSGCLRCWQNRLKHGNKESKAYLAKHPELMLAQKHAYEITGKETHTKAEFEHLWIDAQMSSSVRGLKRQIQDHIQVSADEQSLIVDETGIELDNNGKKLSYYGLNEESTLTLRTTCRTFKRFIIHLHEKEVEAPSQEINKN
jgi:hypothetical protein